MTTTKQENVVTLTNKRPAWELTLRAIVKTHQTDAIAAVVLWLSCGQDDEDRMNRIVETWPRAFGDDGKAFKYDSAKGKKIDAMAGFLSQTEQGAAWSQRRTYLNKLGKKRTEAEVTEGKNIAKDWNYCLKVMRDVKAMGDMWKTLTGKGFTCETIGTANKPTYQPLRVSIGDNGMKMSIPDFIKLRPDLVKGKLTLVALRDSSKAAAEAEREPASGQGKVTEERIVLKSWKEADTALAGLANYLDDSDRLSIVMKNHTGVDQNEYANMRIVFEKLGNALRPRSSNGDAFAAQLKALVESLPAPTEGKPQDGADLADGAEELAPEMTDAERAAIAQTAKDAKAARAAKAANRKRKVA
jgi:hypothetical protein